MKYIATCVLGFMLLASCNPPVKKTILKDTDNAAAKVPLKKRDTLMAGADTVPKILMPRNIINVVENYSPGIKTKITTLQCADFNEDDIDPKDAKLKWTGLFGSNGKYYLKNTKVKFTREQSALDNDGQRTGWAFKSDIKDYNFILIAGDDDIKTGPVQVALTGKALEKAGEKFEFNYNGVVYTLYTTGFKKGGQVYNYKLFLMANVKGRYFNQLLRSLGPDFTFGGVGDMSERIEIEFAGDLDGDSIPDFIIGSSGYAFGNTDLYLSRPAGDKAILKLVSGFGSSD